jgi:hypothetical protein
LRTRSCEEKHEPNLSHDDSFELPMAACVFLVDDPSPCDELDIHGNNYDGERHGNKSEGATASHPREIVEHNI